MKMICFVIGLMLPALFLSVYAEPAPSDLYWVYVEEKEKGSFDPEVYFSQESRERRLRQGLPLSDERDWPVNPAYVSAIAEEVDSMRHVLRWINAITVKATATQIAKISSFPFVKEIRPFEMQAEFTDWTGKIDSARLDTLLSLERNLMQLDRLEEANLSGKGIRIAILDAGFKEANKHPALAHIRARGGILATKDFYQGDDNVYHHSRHGMEVMSCIAGLYGDRQLGCAKDASFLLARIEHERKEPAIEEDHWLAAAEWADRMGADIINSSITYTFKRYTYDQMDGKTAPVSRAAKIATAKGILVICSMGNEGADDWRYLGAPADVPEVLSVGGSQPMIQQHIRFASVGPNALKERKPDIAAPAFVLSAVKKGRFDENAGTSFSTPLVAGIAACLLQQQDDQTPQALADQIRRLGHFYPYYDYELGYGVPDMRRLFDDVNIETPPRFSVFHRSDSVILAMDTSFMRRDSLNFPNGRMLYFHLESPQGHLLSHQAIRLPNKTQYYFFRRMAGISGILRIWLGGYLYEEEI